MTTDPRTANAVGQVAGIRRYPVKSMRGEHVAAAAVDDRGLVGDRLFAVRDAEGKFGSGKNTRRFRRMDGLLDFQARYVGDPGPRFLAELTCPDGTRHPVGGPEADDAVRAHLGRDDVALLPEQSVSHFDDGPIHLLSTASLDWLVKAVSDVAVDERRLRPNLLLDTHAEPFAEDDWIGRTLRFAGAEATPGTAAAEHSGPVIEVCAPTTRCVMVNAAQDDLPYSTRPLKALTERELKLGVWARVLRPGIVRVGDHAFMD